MPWKKKYCKAERRALYFARKAHKLDYPRIARLVNSTFNRGRTEGAIKSQFALLVSMSKEERRNKLGINDWETLNNEERKQRIGITNNGGTYKIQK